jgi:putative membrane protein insertion efficiency factor
MRSLLLLFIRGYQWILRPFLGPNCRFYPSCSCYAHQAIERFGAWRGLGMTVTRLARCHPWNPGGYDPVEPPVIESPQRLDKDNATLA